ncbi:peroxiredoxin-like family protein [Thalassotalea fusca]
MNLRQSLDEYKSKLASTLSKEVLEVLSRNTSLLQERNLAEQAVSVGDTFPAFSLPDSHGNVHSLQETLERGPVIISFFRGGWCPYCVLELKALRDIVNDLPALNATLIAITPETPEHIADTVSRNELNFVVASDHNNQLAKQCGLVFTVPEDLLAAYVKLGIDINSNNGEEKAELPIPATYIVDQQGVIRFAFVEEDYISRAEPSHLVMVLQSL